MEAHNHPTDPTYLILTNQRNENVSAICFVSFFAFIVQFLINKSIIRHQDSFNNSHTVIRLVCRISSDNPVRILLYNPVLGQKVPSTLSTSLALAWLVFLWVT